MVPPQRRPGCPATADLEAHAAGDLPALGSHVARCQECGPYVAALHEEIGAFLRARPPERFVEQLAGRAQAQAWWPRHVRRWLALLAPMAAAAALALVLLRPMAPKGPAGDPGVTLKGDRFRAFVKRGDGEPQPLSPDARVRAGDALRFAYDAPADGWLAIFDLDGTEAVTTFYPYRGREAARVRKGQGLLNGAVVLDDRTGPEWLVAVWAPAAIDLDQLGGELRGQSTRDRLTLGCEGCVISTLRLLKGE